MRDQAENLREKVKEGHRRTGFRKVICIGASTGGPGALARLLAGLPGDFDAPLLIAQHMPAKFTKLLAERLDSIVNLNVKEAVHGEIVEKGTAYIAPGDFHMRVKEIHSEMAVELYQSVPREGHRPSVNELFESVAALQEYGKIAVILTGMGSDGTDGLREIKASGDTVTIAESKESAIIYGMPRVAVESNLIDKVLHIDQMADCLIEIV